MYNIALYFVLFIIYSFLGWIIECIYCSFEQKRFCWDRGFLIGPYCPIYGSCALIMTIVLDCFIEKPIAIFLLVMVGVALIEYFTSLIMEKLFSVRWWDYSHLPLNIEGRVCLIVILGFGLLGLVLMYIVDPFVFYEVSLINHKVLIGISVLGFILFLIDCILSFIIITKLKSKFSDEDGDLTSIVYVEVRKFLRTNKSFFFKLFKIFPVI